MGRWAAVLVCCLLGACSLYVGRHHGGKAGDGGAEADGGDAGPLTACGRCPGDRPICDEEHLRCVACLSNGECNDPNLARCASGTCSVCVNNSACAHLDEKHQKCDVDDGACVQCTVATEAQDCGQFTCNPVTRQCTDTVKGSVDACGDCVSDSDCRKNSLDGKGDRRCVGTFFKGAPHGKFCLTDISTAPSECVRVYLETVVATSVGGIKSTYCAPVASDNTCEGIRDFDTPCTTDADCGAEGFDDGYCRMGSGGMACTYHCGGHSECPESRMCKFTTNPPLCCLLPNC